MHFFIPALISLFQIVQVFRWALGAVRRSEELPKAMDVAIDWDFLERVKRETAASGDECGLVPMEIQAHWEQHGVVPSEYAHHFEKKACTDCGKPF